MLPHTPLPRLWLFFLLLAPVLPALGQAADADTIQNLYFIKKGRLPESRFDDYIPNAHGFYIYRNCQYEFIKADKKWMTCRILDIRRDSLYVSIYLNDSDKWVSRTIPPDEIRGIRLRGWDLEVHSKFSLRAYRTVFVYAARAKERRQWIDTVYSIDSSIVKTYTVIPFFTRSRIGEVREKLSEYFDSAAKERWIRRQTATDRPRPRIRRGVWFTPSGAGEIRGVNIGLVSNNFNKKHSQVISGLNLNVDALSAFMAVIVAPYAVMDILSGGRFSDLSDAEVGGDASDMIKGVSISVGGVVTPGDLHGFSLNGALCAVEHFKGVVISGMVNANESFRGVEICGFYNRSSLGHGVQIGAFNACKHLKGIQIGLWNVNSKRRLPFVNWGS